MPPRTPDLPSARVEADLRRRIEAGEWDHDEAMPAVAALAAEYGVSRTSVSRALRTLADEGLVRIVPRWGTFRAWQASRVLRPLYAGESVIYSVPKPWHVRPVWKVIAGMDQPPSPRQLRLTLDTSCVIHAVAGQQYAPDVEELARLSSQGLAELSLTTAFDDDQERAGDARRAANLHWISQRPVMGQIT